MTENIVSWNIPNFITVGIMGAVGLTLLGMLAAWYQRTRGGGSDAAE